MKLSRKDIMLYIACSICFIHCIATPLIVVGTPLFSSFADNLFLELGLLLISIISGLFILYKGTLNHKKNIPLLIFCCGIILWIIHLLCEYYHNRFDQLFMSISLCLIIGSFILNHLITIHTESKIKK